MPNIKQLVFKYLLFILTPILSANIMVGDENRLLDIKNIPEGTKLSLRCNVPTEKEFFDMPNIIWFERRDKLNTMFLECDYWATHTYEAKIKVISNPKRNSIPKNEFLVIGKTPIIKIDDDEKITYIIPLKEPVELSEIIINHYIDHNVGFYGEIGYIFHKVYPEGLTIKEFDTIMGCVGKIIYPKWEKNHGK